MNLDKSVEIIKDKILGLYDEEIFSNNEDFIEYNFIDYDFIYDINNTLKIDIFCKFFRNRFVLNGVNYNYSENEDESYNHLLNIVMLSINDNNREDKLIIFLKTIYNLNTDYVYSKIVDKLIIKDERDDIENEIIAKMFLKHTEINDCSVCTEPNNVLTKCNHNLCRLCFQKIKKLISCPLCPICRACLECCEEH